MNSARKTKAITLALSVSLVVVCVLAYEAMSRRFYALIAAGTEYTNAQTAILAELRRATASLSDVVASIAVSDEAQQRSHPITPDRRQESPSAGAAGPARVDDHQQPMAPAQPSRFDLTNSPRLLRSSATPEQEASFRALKSRLDDPLFLQNLSLEKLQALHEFQSLPGELQLVLLSKAVDRYNSGEIPPDIFSQPQPGSEALDAP